MTTLQPPVPNRPDPVTVALRLAESVDGLSRRLDDVKKASEDRDSTLTRYGHRNRLLIYVDVLMTAVIAGMGFWISSTAGDASTARTQAAAASAAGTALHVAQLSGCQSGNEQRTGELALWRYLFANSTPPKSAAQKHAIASFMVLVDQTFAQRDCLKVYSLNPSPKGK